MNGLAGLAVAAGFFGFALAPAALILSNRSERVTLLAATIAVAVLSSALGISARRLARRALLRSDLSLGRVGGRKLASLALSLGSLSLCFGLAAAIALTVCGFLILMPSIPWP